MNKYYILIFILLLIMKNSISQNFTDAEVKTAYIYKFGKFVKWENEENIDTFKIGVFGKDTVLYSTLLSLAKIRTLKEKPIIITGFIEVKDITKTQILYVNEKRNCDINKILEKIHGNNTLLISNQCMDQKLVMINFLPKKEGNILFEINKKNIIDENLTAMPELLLIGGTEIDIRELYKEQEKELESEKEKVINREIEIKKQKEELQKQNEKIKEKNTEIDRQQILITEQQERIKDQKTELTKLFSEVKEQQRKLDNKIKILIKQEEEIKNQKNEVETQKNILKVQKDEITDQENKIKAQKAVLNEQLAKIKTQQLVLFLFIALLILISGLVFLIYRGYKIKKEVNKKLEEKNIAITEQNIKINQQNEEICTQSENLMEINALLADKNQEIQTQKKEIENQKEIIEEQSEHQLNQANKKLRQQKKELQIALESLKEAQSMLVQSEKMASLGMLSAGVAHELKNPINYISGGITSLEMSLNDFMEVVEEYDTIHRDNLEEKISKIRVLKEQVEYDELTGEIHKLVGSIKNGVTKTTEIINSLRIYARKDQDKISTADVHLIIDSALILLRNQYKDRIEIITEYGKIPEINCYSGQLNQVFTNIINNAVQAIEDKGKINIKTSAGAETSEVMISIKDTGKGMTDEIKSKIFDPLFTTKEVGEGTGLGLSITKSIIEKHQGKIEVESEPGKGTEFKIILPIDIE